jgi:hypothetical protein
MEVARLERSAILRETARQRHRRPPGIDGAGFATNGRLKRSTEGLRGQAVEHETM